MFGNHVAYRTAMGSLFAVGVLFATSPPAHADDVTIEFEYTVKPPASLPEAIHQITVLKPNYVFRGTEDGIMANSERGWYQLFIRNLQDQFGASMPNVRIYDWEDQVSRGDVTRGEQLNGADPDAKPADARQPTDATMVVRFRVRASTQPIERRESLSGRIAGRFFGRYGGSRHHDNIRYRTKVNVRCEIHLTRVNSGDTLFTYGEDLERISDTDEGFLDLGLGGRSLSELPSTDRLTQELIKEHVDNYLSEFLPVQRSLKARLTRVNRDVRRAVEALNVNDYQEARRIAWKRYERKHKDYAACFVVGATWEVEQDWDEARNWYRRAVQGESQNSYYYNALRRVIAAQHNQRSARARQGVAG